MLLQFRDANVDFQGKAKTQNILPGIIKVHYTDGALGRYSRSSTNQTADGSIPCSSLCAEHAWTRY